MDAFLDMFQITSLSQMTVYRWMLFIGLRFCDDKKSFYVDGHERADVVLDRNRFTKAYLSDYEPYTERWIQMTLVEAHQLFQDA